MATTKKMIEIYTDGACKGNPGKGGWCAILIHEKKTKTISGNKKETTNQEMELTAILKALKAIKKNDQEIEIYSDSKYAIDGITSWIYSWIKNDWKNSAKKDVVHKEIWQEIYKESKKHFISWKHVKAHNGNYYNEMADKGASNEAESVK